jgi:hypothetical protein
MAVDLTELEASKITTRLTNEKDLWWVVIGLDQTQAKPRAVVQTEGGTSLSDMVSHLSDDLLQYGAFKVLGVDQKGAVTSTRTKIVCFQW